MKAVKHLILLMTRNDSSSTLTEGFSNYLSKKCLELKSQKFTLK